MGTHTQDHFHNRKIILDGNEYDGCHFDSCELIYEGGVVPIIKRCTIVNCKFVFNGAADRTLDFMGMLWEMGGYSVVDGIVDYIKKKK